MLQKWTDLSVYSYLARYTENDTQVVGIPDSINKFKTKQCPNSQRHKDTKSQSQLRPALQDLARGSYEPSPDNDIYRIHYRPHSREIEGLYYGVAYLPTRKDPYHTITHIPPSWSKCTLHYYCAPQSVGLYIFNSMYGQEQGNFSNF